MSGPAPVAGLDARAWERELASGPLPWAARVADAAGFSGAASTRRVDDLTVVDWESGAFAGVRGPRQVAAGDGDHFVARIVRSGSEVFAQGGREWVLRAGDAVAWESRSPARFAAAGPVATRSVLIPRDVLEDVGCPLVIGRPRPGRVPAVRLLAGYLESLAPLLPDLAPGPAVAARNALLELGWGALQPESPLDPQALAPARRAAVERYLDARLGRSDLGVDEVAAAHGVSVRTLGRLFSAGGETFSGVLRAKRVARVREELLTGDSTVAALARRWGFFDTSHLNRRFRAVHGVSPHEYRARHRG
ncbi:AraC family transcriptional regulator [Actinosynnema mirum]|uniref:Transcriptional regulator, AraC family n=1 Tax=Actinosynnema mirum (strain ATCC 29888 / DSM 43827 / JCM 3225 / NBRC 14064 / NCIMB 13271 / NRRL B-12336 / IMRU 3971 / 101) TaxID=446462 RepID=C6WAU0_ACTMD|nr:AraC family transcriptional regulator [Actinosynnema mirum]ACU37409.1 transcriptional regulator, AraC family [Actinosynnema mirum DSM 43827]